MEAVYRFDQMKSEPTEVRRPLRKLTLSVPQRSDLAAGEAAAARGLAIAHGMDLARDLGNLPGNVCTPTYLGERALELAQRVSRRSRSTVLERKEIEALGMGSFLSVTNGSDEPPRFIVLEYQRQRRRSRSRVVLVGKGITFDTGGISIKPGRRHGPDEVRHVRRGGGVRHAPRDRRAQGRGQPGRPGRRLREHAVGPRDQARRHRQEHVGPDDRGPQHRRRGPADPRRRAHLRRALRARGGRRHRDADRRDGDRARPRRVRRVQQQRRAGARAGRRRRRGYDRGWQLPLWDDYQDGLNSNFADFANVAGRAGGSITAACFLSRFAKKYDWAHLDIAGIAWKDGKEKGATGRPVPLLDDVAARAGGVRPRPDAPAPPLPPMTTIDFYTHCGDPLDVAATARREGLGAARQRARADPGRRRRPTRSTGCCGRCRRPASCRIAGSRAALAAETPILVDHALDHDGPAACWSTCIRRRRRSSRASSGWSRSSARDDERPPPGASAGGSTASAATSCARTTWRERAS